MKFTTDTIPFIRKALGEPLPGEDAQYHMAPGYRPRLTKEQILSNNPRVGGVLLLLYEKQNRLHIVFTLRKEYQGVHSAQVSFPGGKRDEGDVDTIATALRETREEIGVNEDRVEILGRLTELYIPPSNFLVYPTVGFAQDIGSFNASKDEVEKILEIPVDFFLDDHNTNMQAEVKLFDGNVVKVPGFIFEGRIIWGATAIMLAEFIYILNKIDRGV